MYVLCAKLNSDKERSLTKDVRITVGRERESRTVMPVFPLKQKRNNEYSIGKLLFYRVEGLPSPHQYDSGGVDT